MFSFLLLLDNPKRPPVHSSHAPGILGMQYTEGDIPKLIACGPLPSRYGFIYEQAEPNRHYSVAEANCSP
jgi:hypothetical protein